MVSRVETTLGVFVKFFAVTGPARGAPYGPAPPIAPRPSTLVDRPGHGDGALGVSAFLTVRATPVRGLGDLLRHHPQPGRHRRLPGRALSPAAREVLRRPAHAATGWRRAWSRRPRLGLTAEEVQRRISTAPSPTPSCCAATRHRHRRRPGRCGRPRRFRRQFVELVQSRRDHHRRADRPIRIEVVGRRPEGQPHPVSPQPVRNLALGGLVGLLARRRPGRRCAAWSTPGCATPPACNASPAARCSATIPFDPDARKAPLIVGDAATSARAEAVRQVAHQPAFVDVARAGAHHRGDQRVAGRGQVHHRLQPRHRVRRGRQAGAAGRRRPAPPAGRPTTSASKARSA